MKKILSVLLALVLTLGLCVTASAEGTASAFAQDAYATVLTASDFQRYDNSAYERFDKILNLAKSDGMPEPDSLLIGGDYTMFLYDNAVPGIAKIRGAYLDAYPGVDPASAVFCQGNHDNPKKELTETGFYNMGAYCLYVINEDDFPWKQSKHTPDGVQALAKDVERCLDGMIASGDHRPVIVLTHVPLHHTYRNSYGDNMYAAYLFDVLNEKGKALDIVFAFGHNHSGGYDDYIGGAVNFMQPGDTIRIPMTDKTGENCYTEQTLHFTYTNCGYVGFSDNAVSDTSTDTLTMGVLQLTPDTLHFIKYSEQGVYRVYDVRRVHGDSTVTEPEYPAMVDNCFCHSEKPIVKALWNVYAFFCKLLSVNRYCVCGAHHF